MLPEYLLANVCFGSYDYFTVVKKVAADIYSDHIWGWSSRYICLFIA